MRPIRRLPSLASLDDEVDETTDERGIDAGRGSAHGPDAGLLGSQLRELGRVPQPHQRGVFDCFHRWVDQCGGSPACPREEKSDQPAERNAKQ